MKIISFKRSAINYPGDWIKGINIPQKKVKELLKATFFVIEIATKEQTARF